MSTTAQPPVPDPREPGPRPHVPLPTRVFAGVLLATPVLALVIVPLYARSGPAVLGFPFFYWYQFLWVPLAALLTYSAHVLIARAPRAPRDGGRR